MSSRNIADIMSMSTDDVVEPVVLPAGEYVFRVLSYKPGNIKNEKATPYVRMNLKPIEVVEADTEVDLSNAENVQHDHWMTDKSQSIVKRFFSQNLGLETKDRSFRELFEEAVGLEVTGVIEIKMEGKDKNVATPRIKTFKRVAA